MQASPAGEPRQLAQLASPADSAWPVQLSAKPAQPPSQAKQANFQVGRRRQQAQRHQQALEQGTSLEQASVSPGPRGVWIRDMHISLPQVGNFKGMECDSILICI